MNAKERFLTALNKQQPDMVPLYDFLFSPAIFKEVIGKTVEAYDAVDAVACAKRLEFDGIWIPIGGYGGYAPAYINENTYIDEWGTTYCHNDASWPIDAPIAYPIKNREDYKNWKAPDPSDPARVQPLKDALKFNQNEIALGAGVLGPFTCASMLMGMEEMSIAFYEDPELVSSLIQEGADFSLKAGLKLIEAGADAIIIGDDLGYTNNLFASPATMRQYVLPRLKTMVEAYHVVGCKVILHCDGNINAILADVVGLGIDGLHPIEKKAGMNLSQIKKGFGTQVCLFGNVDSSTTLAYGTKEEIEEEVKQCLRDAAQGGGYIIGSDHSISKGVPVENAFAMFDAIKRYRKYPIAL